MNDALVDGMAKGLAGRPGLGRRAVLLLGGGVAAALLPDAAVAGKKAKRLCRKGGGVTLTRGACHCALTCDTLVTSVCHGNDACFCGESVEGAGVCVVQNTVNPACAATSDCPAGATCIRIPHCPGSGNACASTSDCQATDPWNACLAGRCERTFCLLACPPAR